MKRFFCFLFGHPDWYYNTEVWHDYSGAKQHGDRRPPMNVISKIPRARVTLWRECTSCGAVQIHVAANIWRDPTPKEKQVARIKEERAKWLYDFISRYLDRINREP